MTDDRTIPLPPSMPAPSLRLAGLPATGRPRAGQPLALRIGYDMQFDLAGPSPTAMLLMLYVHPDVAGHLDRPERLVVERTQTAPTSAPASFPSWGLPPTDFPPPTLAPPVETFFDGFGNRCARLVAPAGGLRVAYDAVFHGTYDPEPQAAADARQHPAGELPADVLPFLLGSRYCEVDLLSAVAWDLFGKVPAGGRRVLAVNDWVFRNVRFGYKLTRPNKTALDTYVERTGVCRDMTHLAVTFCRALNVPARYATGYLGDIDADPDPTPMDFSAFYEVYLEGRWWPMDARHGRARVGRVLMARGRDATDVALVTTFGRHRLTKFTVVTEELAAGAMHPAMPVPLAMSA